MKNRFASILAILLLALLSASCEKTKQEQIRGFKNEFEQMAPSFRNGFFRSVYLEDEGQDSLKVCFVINTPDENLDRKLTNKMGQSWAFDCLGNLESLKEVADSEIPIRLVFISSDAVEVANMFFDKRILEETNPEGPIRNRMVSTKTPSASGKSQKIEETIEEINRGLPLKVAGDMIVERAQAEGSILVYIVKVPDNLAQMIKEKGAGQAKQDILSDPAFENFFAEAKSRGITAVRYDYFSTQRKKVLSVSISAADFE